MATGFFQYLPAGICLPLPSSPTTGSVSVLACSQNSYHVTTQIASIGKKFGILRPELYSQTTDTDLESGVACRLMVSLVET